MVAGHAWKAEGVLAAFYARHVRPALGAATRPWSPGSSSRDPIAPYAILRLDWFRPTAGELGISGGVPRAHAALVEERERPSAASRR